MTDVGLCLKIAQAKFDISSAELGRRLDVAPQQILRWRKSKNLKFHTVEQLVSQFGIGIDEFCALGR